MTSCDKVQLIQCNCLAFAQTENNKGKWFLSFLSWDVQTQQKGQLEVPNRMHRWWHSMKSATSSGVSWLFKVMTQCTWPRELHNPTEPHSPPRGWPTSAASQSSKTSNRPKPLLLGDDNEF